MAVPFIYFLLFFVFSLPCFSFKCPNNQVKCGDFDINYPFFTNTTPSECRGKYLVECDGSVPILQFGGGSYAVMNVSYPSKVITIQDKAFSQYFAGSNCSFLFNFTAPILHFNLSNGFSTLVSTNSSNCSKVDTDLFKGVFRVSYNSDPCRDYNLYYSDEDHSLVDLRQNCLSAKPTLFEWILSFNEDDESFSLLSAGFSRQVKLQEDCFSCQKTMGYCSRNGGGVSSCKCDHSCKNKGSRSKKKTIGIVAGAGGALILGCSVVLFLYMNRRRRRQQSSLLSQSISSEISLKNDTELVDTTYHTHIFSYEELEEATDSFNESRELGDGGFGIVYKGELKDGRTVAVKRLFEKNCRRLAQFMNEIEILSYLRHPNLVTLYGCTSRHSRGLLLVYEFISNGTLADHLHGPLTSRGVISWPIRISIAIQTADALAYLHSVEPQIIHRDVKTSNILLDKNFHVKVADFGLSRLLPLDVTHVSTAPQGTPGYVDPEYHQCYQLTDKSDVYSFGVVLIELISSKPAVDIGRNRHEINLANMAITKIQNRQIDQLVDFELGYQSDLEINRMIDHVAEIAFQCLQSERDMRPSIREVLEILKKIEGGEYKADKKNVSSFSLDTVTDQKWPSRSTTSNSSS